MAFWHKFVHENITQAKYRRPVNYIDLTLFVGKQINTPLGEGLLKQVSKDKSTVCHGDNDKVDYYKTSDLLDLLTGQQLNCIYENKKVVSLDSFKRTKLT